MELEQGRNTGNQQDTGQYDKKNTKDTTINTKRSVIHGNRTVGCENSRDMKRLKMAKRTERNKTHAIEILNTIVNKNMQIEKTKAVYGEHDLQ